MSIKLASSVPREPRVLKRSTACRGCGYELLGLKSEGNCPECGTAIAISRRLNLLRFTDPDWVAEVARGLWWMAMYVAMTAMDETGQIWMPGLISEPVRSAICAIAASLGACGGWLVATPDPSGTDREFLPRRLLRFLGFGPLAYELAAFPLADRHLSPALSGAGGIMKVAALILAFANCSVLLIYVKRLCERVPDSGPSPRRLLYSWFVLEGYTVAFWSSWYFLTAVAKLALAKFPALITPLMCISALTSFGAHALLMLIVLWAYHHVYYHSRLARENWTPSGPGGVQLLYEPE